MSVRVLDRIIPSIATSDGAGVKLRRSLGQSPASRLDPFLMLDQFSTDNPDDYIAGFPQHPHRGFETVTYMIEGHMRHEDHLGHRGELKSGGAQWMTAGRGILHSEMPLQDRGRMRGFQLWVNLPAREKLKPAAYRDLQPEEIPTVDLSDGGRARLLAGRLRLNGAEISGPIRGISTDPLFVDVSLPVGAQFQQPIPRGHNALIYPFEGQVEIGHDDLPKQSAGILSNGNSILVTALRAGARFLLLAGRPLGEPIVQYGPFVMNSREEIEQAIADYNNGELV